MSLSLILIIKNKTEMKGFYKLDGVPNKTAYVYSVTKEHIKFLAFFNEGNGLKAHKHTAHIKSKRDFKKMQECFSPTHKVHELINEALKDEDNSN